MDVDSDGVLLASFTVRSTLVDEIQTAPLADESLSRVRAELPPESDSGFRVRDDGVLMFRERICVPAMEQLRQKILTEAHTSAYSIHPGTTKMYRGVRELYWWPELKRDVAEFVARCLICQQVKAERQRPGGLLQSLPIPEWK